MPPSIRGTLQNTDAGKAFLTDSCWTGRGAAFHMSKHLTFGGHQLITSALLIVWLQRGSAAGVLAEAIRGVELS